jgi:3-deoxy-D-manno-octulosonic-acid transferase
VARLKWAIYNVLFALVYPFLLPGFLLRMLRRGGYAKRFADRFALYPDEVRARLCGGRGATALPRLLGHDAPVCGDSFAPVWIHAVSVGEVQVAGQLMREWRQVEPGVRFCFSTTSSTGWKMAEKEVGPNDVLIYNPLDFPNFVKSALKTVRPRAVVLTESEIWPNFIRFAKKYGIPLFLVNARVSDRSAPRYRLAKCFFGDVFRCFTKIFAQSDLDRDRLVAAGAPGEKVEVTGSFKFDVAHRNEAKEQELREWIDANGGAGKILLGGSTWPGEDEVLLRIYKRISEERKEERVTLVIAPRHFEKADAVEENIRKAGFGCVRRSRQRTVNSEQRTDVEVRSRFAAHPEQDASATESVHCSLFTVHSPSVFLADTTGELMGLYGIADVVFVGKSLCAHGSQNMIEPCLCGKPTFVGPYTENFRPVMSDLLAADAIVQVRDEKELEDGIRGLFFNAENMESGRRGDENHAVKAPGLSSASPNLENLRVKKTQGLGERAKAAVERRRGVVAKCVTEIRGAIG